MLLPVAGALEAADERLARLLTEETIERVAGMIPDAWLAGGTFTPHETWRSYAKYLSSRLRSRRVFVEEAIRARSRV